MRSKSPRVHRDASSESPAPPPPERELQCPHCPAKFWLGPSLDIHVAKVHGCDAGPNADPSPSLPTSPVVTDAMIDAANRDLEEDRRAQAAFYAGFDEECVNLDAFADLYASQMVADLRHGEGAPKWVRLFREFVAARSRRPEPLGTIDPAMADIFLAAVDLAHGRNDFIEIDPVGGVTVAAKFTPVERTELAALKGYVRSHNEWAASVAQPAAA